MWPGLVHGELMQRLAINERSFGWINSIYYCSYGLMQIPMAIFFDRFSYRSVFSVCSLLCGVSFWLLNVSNSLWIVFLMSGILGASSAAGILGTSKVLSLWFPRKMYSRMLGISLGIGLLGCIVGKGSVIDHYVQFLGSQSVAKILSAGFILLSVLMMIFMCAPKEDKKEGGFCWPGFFVLMRSPLMWGLGAVNFLLMGAQGGFADVWGASYMAKSYELSRANALDLIQFIFLGVVMGSPIMPWLGKKLSDFSVTLSCGLLISFIFFMMTVSSYHYPQGFLRGVMFFIGLLCSYQTNLLSIGVDFVDKRLMGVTVGFLNSLNMIGGAFFNASIGTLISMGQGGGKTLADYKVALSVIPVAAVLGSLIFLAIRRSAFWKKVSF